MGIKWDFTSFKMEYVSGPCSARFPQFNKVIHKHGCECRALQKRVKSRPNKMVSFYSSNILCYKNYVTD